MKLRLEPHGDGGAPRVERTAEVQPHLTEERYRALAETVGAVPWEAEPTTDRVTYVGPQIEAVTGYTPEEWMTIGAWARAMHPDDRDAAVQRYEWHLQRRRDHNLEYRVIAKSGLQIWFRDIITFVTNADGREMVRGLMIVIEEEKALERALRDSEARYSHAERIAKLVHWSLALDPDGDWEKHRLTYSNTAVEIFGLPPDKLQLTNAEFLARLIHPDDHDHVRVDTEGRACKAAVRALRHLPYRPARRRHAAGWSSMLTTISTRPAGALAPSASSRTSPSTGSASSS